LQPESINTPEGVRDLAAWQPELLVVAAYGQILSREVLAAAPLGGINVHASLLPKYRGAAPIAWAIYHGEKETGVTIIRMSVHLDAGDILAQASTAIGDDETAGELEARLAPMGARLAVDVIERMAAGPVQGVKQDKSQATKAPKLQKEHGLLDWTRPSQAVCNQIRAMQPWPTAYTFLQRPDHAPLRLIVFKARPAPEMTLTTRDPSPGRVRAGAAGDQLFVESGGGNHIEILELQPAGKRRMSARAFLLGHPLRDGFRMGAEYLQ
jgi:methionyl-tRNA formyltransferase